MPATNGSELAAFDADRVREVVQRTVSSPLYTFCEYDTESFRPLYIDDSVISMYENRDAMLEHFERIHTNVHMDFIFSQRGNPAASGEEESRTLRSTTGDYNRSTLPQ